MKLDDEVKMISGESPIIFSKACELFIIELAYKSWVNTLENNRRTLQRVDIANAINRTDNYDFLLDIVEENCKKKLLFYANSYINKKNGLFNLLNNNDKNLQNLNTVKINNEPNNNSNDNSNKNVNLNKKYSKI
jgi:nuclear transcription factor Y gamma